MPLNLTSKISRKPLVLWVAVCLVVSALAIPLAAHLPRWVETELVFGAWWLVWLCVLTWLLYHGHEVEDDAQVDRPNLLRRQDGAKTNGSPSTDGCLDNVGCIDPSGCLTVDEGCGQALLVVAALVVFGLAIWLVVEFLVPAIAMLLLASIGGMMARAVNDRHECQGRFGFSLVWGFLWATVYIGPIAALAIWGAVLIQHMK